MTSSNTGMTQSVIKLCLLFKHSSLFSNFKQQIVTLCKTSEYSNDISALLPLPEKMLNEVDANYIIQDEILVQNSPICSNWGRICMCVRKKSCEFF